MTGSGRPDTDRRLIRIFVSSTFHDFQDERDLLVKQVFPELRRVARERAVELVDVDLRWGITAEQSERGDTLPVCLDEIDQCRPYFIGLLGERYGWVPPPEAIKLGHDARFDWVASEAGASVTELEILHGVLNRPEMAARAFFYFRDPAWAIRREADGETRFLSDTPVAASRLEALKDRIRNAGCRVVENYSNPAAVAQRIGADLLRVIDEAYPLDAAPGAASLAARQQAAYALDRQGVYLEDERSFSELDQWAGQPAAVPMLVVGPSGGGKSALLANWTARHRDHFPADIIFEHYLGATTDSGDPLTVVRRWAQKINGLAASNELTQAATAGLAESFAACVAAAEVVAEKTGQRWMVVLDGLDRLSAMADLRWLPKSFPDRVRVIASSIDEPMDEWSGDHSPYGLTRLEARAEGATDKTLFRDIRSETAATDAWRRRGWAEFAIAPLAEADRRRLIELLLARHRKTLTAGQVGRIIAHPLSGLPLFVKTLVNELRVFGVYEELDARLDWYLQSDSVRALFDRLLKRLEEDCGEDITRRAMSLIWASRTGLEEVELLKILQTVPAVWAPLNIESADILTTALGRITFGHEFLRRAVEARYLARDADKAAAHLAIADHFERHAQGARQAEETPWQLRAAGAWDRLEALLTDIGTMTILQARGEEETLGYWLSLEPQGPRPEKALCEAWFRRFPGEAKIDDAALASGRRLAGFLAFCGARDPESLALCEQLFAAHRRRLGPENPETLEAMHLLSQALTARGRWSAAETLDQQLLDVQLKTLGADHPGTLHTVIVLAGASIRRRLYDRAITLLRPVVETAEQKFGAEAPLTLAGKTQLAEALAGNGDLVGVEALRRSVYASREKILGGEHPATLDALESIVSTLIDRGELAHAEFQARRLLETRERTLGEDHPDTLRALKLLAIASSLVDDTGAEAKLALAISEYKRVLGAKHPETLEAQQEMANKISQKVDRQAFPEIEKILREVLEVRIEVLGPNRPEILETMDLLASVLLRERKVQEAVTMQSRLLDECRRLYGADSAVAHEVQERLNWFRQAQRNPKIIDDDEDRNIRWAPALGVAFDIDKLDRPFYGYASYRILFDALSPDLFNNTRWRDGDTNSTLAGDERTCLISIEAADAAQIEAIRSKVMSLSHPALLQGARRFVIGRALEAEPLVVAMRIGRRGSPDFSVGDSFPLRAWVDARKSREAGAAGKD